jgi:hypothetical protein
LPSSCRYPNGSQPEQPFSHSRATVRPTTKPDDDDDTDDKVFAFTRDSSLVAHYFFTGIWQPKIIFTIFTIITNITVTRERHWRMKNNFTAKIDQNPRIENHSRFSFLSFIPAPGVALLFFLLCTLPYSVRMISQK